MDKIKNIDFNVVKIGRTQDKEFQEIKNRLQILENNQRTLQQNMVWLGNKLDEVIELMKKK
jgi:predicted transcriptional regulator